MAIYFSLISNLSKSCLTPIKIQYSMIQQQVQAALTAIHLHLEPAMIQAISDTLSTLHHPNSTNCIDRVIIYACTALAGQCQQLPSATNHLWVRAGPKIEAIMRLLNSEHKTRLLDCVEQLILKWNSRHPLTLKVKEIRRNYIKFNNFMALCAELNLLASVNRELSEIHGKLLWLAYLNVKLTQNQSISQHYQNQLLYCLIGVWFDELSEYLPPPLLQSKCLQYFRLQRLPTLRRVEENRQIFKDLFISIYALRYDIVDAQRVKKLLTRPVEVERYLDDMRKEVDSILSQKGDQVVNELSFASIDVLLPPETNKKESMQPIVKPVNFEFSEDEREDLDNNIQEHSSPEGDADSVMVDEVERQGRQVGEDGSNEGGCPHIETTYKYWQQTQRVHLLKWVLSTIRAINFEETPMFEEQFRQMFGQSYCNYAMVRRRLCGIIVDKYGGDKKVKEQRIDQMLTLFVYFVRKMIGKASAKEVFFSVQNLDGTLCITSLLFGHCFRWAAATLRESSEIFHVSLTETFKSINFIGCDTSLPTQLKRFLYSIQGKLLMQDIWQDGPPEELFCKKNLLYTKCAMFCRLQHHATKCVKQIGQGKANDRQLLGMTQLMSQVLQDGSPILIQTANINTLVVCSAAYNFPQHRNLIQRVINRYIAIYPFGSRPNFQARNNTGSSIDLQEYYQTIFAPYADKLPHSHKAQPKTRTPEPKVVETQEGNLPMTPVKGSRVSGDRYRERYSFCNGRLACEYEAQSKPQ